MSDLTDEELTRATSRTISFNPNDVVTEAAMLHRAAIEIRRLRKIAAVAIELAESDTWPEQDRLLERLQAVVKESK